MKLLWQQDSHDGKAIDVDDIYAAVAQIKQWGGKIIRDAGPMNAVTVVTAFPENLEGYVIELLGER